MRRAALARCWLVALSSLGLSRPLAAQDTPPDLEAVLDAAPEGDVEHELAVPFAAAQEPVDEESFDEESVDEEHTPRVTTPFTDLRLGRDDAGLGDGAWASASVFAGLVRNDAIVMGAVDLGVRFAIGEDARASLDWGFAFADTRVRGAYGGATTAEPFDMRLGRVEGRNADLRFEWLPRLTDSVRFGFGLGAAIPVAATTSLPNNATSQAALDASTLVHEAYLASFGADRPWRFRPERAAVYVPLTLVFALADNTVLTFDAAAALGVRVLGGMGAELLGDLQLGAELGSAVASSLRLGGRLSVTALALGTTASAAQPAAEAWARLELAPISVLARVTLGVGGPYGVGGDFVGWGAHLGAAASF